MKHGKHRRKSFSVYIRKFSLLPEARRSWLRYTLLATEDYKECIKWPVTIQWSHRPIASWHAGEVDCGNQLAATSLLARKQWRFSHNASGRPTSRVRPCRAASGISDPNSYNGSTRYWPSEPTNSRIYSYAPFGLDSFSEQGKMLRGRGKLFKWLEITCPANK